MLLENAVEGPETQEVGRLERCKEALSRLNMRKVDSCELGARDFRHAMGSIRTPHSSY